MLPDSELDSEPDRKPDCAPPGRARTDSPPPDGTLLTGGTANAGRIIRVGDTVHRPRGPQTPAVHALLNHLERSGFAGSPRVVRCATESGDEVLTFIEGAAASEPLPAWACGDELLASVGVLHRSFHDHAADFVATGRRWLRPVPAAWQGDLVCHNDVNPANVVFVDGRAVALIDFDLASPATPAWDLAVAACLWVPLRHDADVTGTHRLRRRDRFRVFLDGYGASAALMRDVAAALVPANQWIAAIIKDNARNGHPAFGRVWERRRAVHARAGAWLAHHADGLA